jgi:hypothetical protein
MAADCSIVQSVPVIRIMKPSISKHSRLLFFGSLEEGIQQQKRCKFL